MNIVSILEQLKGFGLFTVMIIFCLVVLGIIFIVKTFIEARDLFGKSHRQLKDEHVTSEINRLDQRITNMEKNVNERIDTLFEKQDGYHGESIDIRKELADNQNKLFETIASFTTLLTEIRDDLVEEKVERKRWNILNFADELRYGDGYADRERFDNVFRDYDDYERIITDCGMKNGFVEESIKFIRLKCQEMMDEK